MICAHVLRTGPVSCPGTCHRKTANLPYKKMLQLRYNAFALSTNIDES